MKIKVLHVIHSLSGGGAEKQLQLLCNGMDRSQFDVAVFCVNDLGNDINGDQAAIFKSLNSKAFSIGLLNSIYNAIKEHNPDVIHVWLPASISIPAMIVGRLLGKKIIFSYRNKMYFHRGLSYPEFLIAFLCANKIVSNHEIVDSHLLFKWLYKLKFGLVVNNAVSVPDEFVKKKLSKNVGSKMIFVGRLTIQKNLIRLIKALSNIDKELEWHLDVYGDGEDRGIVDLLITEYSLQEKIKVHGFSSSIYQALSGSTALLFPSLKEGMPNVLVEAMAIGLPVVAGDIAGNRSVVLEESQDAVVWVNPENVEDMTNEITSFITGKYNVENMIKAGKLISSHYTLEKMITNYQLCYKNVRS